MLNIPTALHMNIGTVTRQYINKESEKKEERVNAEAFGKKLQLSAALVVSVTA